MDRIDAMLLARMAATLQPPIRMAGRRLALPSGKSDRFPV